MARQVMSDEAGGREGEVGRRLRGGGGGCLHTGTCTCRS